jgi:hypothetical protein
MDFNGIFFINDFMCARDFSLNLDTALPHSLHSRCFLGSYFPSRRDLLAVTSAWRLPSGINNLKH